MPAPRGLPRAPAAGREPRGEPSECHQNQPARRVTRGPGPRPGRRRLLDASPREPARSQRRGPGTRRPRKRTRRGPPAAAPRPAGGRTRSAREGRGRGAAAAVGAPPARPANDSVHVARGRHAPRRGTDAPNRGPACGRFAGRRRRKLPARPGRLPRAPRPPRPREARAGGRAAPPPHLVHRAAREVQRPEQQLELHGGREAVEAEADVVDDRGREQRRDAGRRPQLVRGAQLVVQPQARVALPHGRHLGGEKPGAAAERASYEDTYAPAARTPNMAAPARAGCGDVAGGAGPPRDAACDAREGPQDGGAHDRLCG